MITEPLYAGEFVLSEANRTRSRAVVTIDQNQTLVAGAVLGTSSVGALSGALTALGTNTGNPTIGAITVAAGTALGEYDIVMEDATHFVVLAPPVDAGAAGQEVGHGVFGAAFAGGGLGFTITAGGVACIDTDSFKLLVSAVAGDGNYVAFNPAAVDGSQNASAINWSPITTGAGVTQSAVVINRAAEVKGALLNWGAATNLQIAAGIAQLAALGIIVR